MDLLQTVRKEGSRGGVNFSWDDVRSSQHRENYLGHSLMAPVGRWQKNRDLSWYAKADDADLTPEERAEKERLAKREELRKVKEAEEDAMAHALGLPVPDRTNANNEPLGMDRVSQQEVNKALKEALGDEGEEEEKVRSGGGDRRRRRDDGDERSGKRRRRSRSRSRGGDRERRHRHRHYSRSRSRSRSVERRRRRSRSRDDRPKRRTERDNYRSSRDQTQHRRKSRSRSSHERRRHRDDR